MDIRETAKEIHANATDHGWHEIDRSALENHALFHSEIAEATESVRNNEVPLWRDNDGKYQGEAIELADCVIRIFDYFEWRGWNIEECLRLKMEYNKTRPYRHGGKKY